MANLPLKVRWAVFLGLALLALAVRLPRLGERPMHTDEAVNAYITGQLLAGEEYHYDPQDRHGPALYLAALPIANAAGAKNLAGLSETTVRLVPVIWSVLTLLLFAAVASQSGFFAAAIAATLWAIAPLPVYYGRYFIHETLFVAATLAFLIAGWRTLETRSLRAAVTAGLAAGFMLACKETALLHFAALGIAGSWWVWSRSNDSTPPGMRWRGLIRAACVALAAFGILVVALYTWGGQHWVGPLDLVRSIPRFASRATGEGHEKPFWYYLELLANGTGWAVLAFAITGAMTTVQARVSRFHASNLFKHLIAIYAAAIFFIYSLIPYKTPWLALNLWLPIALLAGIGFGTLWFQTRRKLALRIVLAICGLVTLGALGRDTWKWSFAKPADEKNPYAYAHTGEDLLRLPERLNQLAGQRNPPGKPLIAVVAADPWPLPWYLRKFPRVGYWQPDQDPGSADLYITSLAAAEKLAPRLENWRPEFFGVRPEVLLLLWTPPVETSHE